MAEKVYGRKLGRGAEEKKGKPAVAVKTAMKEAEKPAGKAATTETAAEKKPAAAEKKPTAAEHDGKKGAEKKKESEKTREENEKRREERRKKFGRIEIKKQPKSDEAKKNIEAISEKWKPTFRGRFGKRWLRKPSKAKWNRWRAPRGIDMHCRQEDGMLPQPGYRTPVKIRHMHPSGYMEILVGNLAEIKAAGKDKAVRIAGKIGRKKKRMMLEEAQKLGLRIVNP